MAKKSESEKIRYKKVFAPNILGVKKGEAVITGEYPTLEAAKQSPEKGRIMTPLQAARFIKKWNKSYNAMLEKRKAKRKRSC